MRYLLAFFFLFMYMGDHLGINISLGPGMSTKNLLLYLILAGIAINAAVARNRDFDLPSVAVPFALLIIYSIMTWITVAFIFADPIYSVRQSFIVLKSSWVDLFLTFLIYFYGLLHLKDSWWLLKAMIWIGVIGNVITIIDTFNIPNLGILTVPRRDRFEGFLGQPNAYGQFLVLFIPAVIALYRSQTGKMRVLAGFGAFASIVALIMTGSRGAYVGLIGGGILAAIFLRRYIPRMMVLKTGVISLLVCGVIIGITFVTGHAEIYLERTLDLEGSIDVVSHGRTRIWATALKPMIEQPISLLTGFGFFSYESGLYRKSTHNAYLSVFYNLGVIGISLYLVIFIRVLATARSAIVHCVSEYRSQLIAVVFGLLGFMIATVFSEYQRSGYLLWAYLGIGMRIAMQVIPRTAASTAYSDHVVSGRTETERRALAGARGHSVTR